MDDARRLKDVRPGTSPGKVYVGGKNCEKHKRAPPTILVHGFIPDNPKRGAMSYFISLVIDAERGDWGRTRVPRP